MEATLVRRCICLLALAVAVAPVLADEFVDRANAPYRAVRPQKRSDVVLLPALAVMAVPPAAVATPEQAMLLPADGEAFGAAREWAMGEAQRAALAALDQITAEEHPVEAMVFAQPYGAEALAATSEGIQLIRQGLYTELGDPPLLAAAKVQYLPALDRLGSLVHVEATRLAAEGKVEEAAHLMIDWVFFSRQMADRSLFEEVRWGMRTMIAALERVRDLVYVDFRHGSRTLTQGQILGIIERLGDTGYIGLDRIQFPRGDRMAAEQLVARTYQQRGGVNPNTFAATLARMTSKERPLRLFSEAARWEQVGAVQGNWFDTTEKLARVYDDWLSRWPLDPFDSRMGQDSEFAAMKPPEKMRFAAIVAALKDLEVLFNDRQVLRTQLVGTRAGLAVTAFYYRNRNFPPQLASVRPTYLARIDADPFNPDRARGLQPPPKYFVPIRDVHFGPRETPRPHLIRVFDPASRFTPFQIQVADDQFVLYSVGPDAEDSWAELSTGEPAKGSAGDLLLWPPVVSLHRQHLQETGRLK